MLDHYNRYGSLLEAVGYHMYLHANEGYFMLERHLDQVGTISDQLTPEDWERQFRTSEDIGQKFKLFQNPKGGQYILEVCRFGENARLPADFFLTETDPALLGEMLNMVVDNIRFSAKPKEVYRTEVVTSSGSPEYTESQVITLIKMLRGDLNVPGSEETIRRLLKAVK